jgi:hypothetical protein
MPPNTRQRSVAIFKDPPAITATPETPSKSSPIHLTQVNVAQLPKTPTPLAPHSTILSQAEAESRSAFSSPFNYSFVKWGEPRIGGLVRVNKPFQTST